MNVERLSLRRRLPAFAIHFGISLALFAVLMAIIILYWYPGPFFAWDGGWRGTLIVVGVDLVLGPTLTLVVFDPRKERRKILFDLTVIGLLQLFAMVWGISVVESQRPIAASLHDGALHPVTAQAVRDQGYELSSIKRLSQEHPALLVVQMPDDQAGRERVAKRMREDGLVPPVQVELLVPLAGKLEQVRIAERTVERLARVNPTFQQELDEFYAAHPDLGREDTFTVPFYGRYGAVIVVVDRHGRWLGALSTAFKGILE